MPTVLSEIVANKRREVAERRRLRPEPERPVARADGAFLNALHGDGVKLIAEIKPSSPSAGVIAPKLDLAATLDAYDRYAAAISVLTDEKYFGGSLQLLAETSRRASRPTLCKDFILDPLQVVEARAAGAQAVLLIVKILDDDDLAALHQEIISLGMTPLVEIQNEAELARALRLQPQATLINNRDLETFEISFETTRRLAPQVPPGIVTVSASGVQSRADIEALLPYCSRFLVGTSLMKVGNPAEALKGLVAAS